jgi:hypothetical protein
MLHYTTQKDPPHTVHRNYFAIEIIKRELAAKKIPPEMD